MKRNIYEATYRIVLALVKVLLHKGVSYGEFAHIIRRAYVEATEQQLLKSEGKATTSRIAIVTGLTRKEVGQIRKEEGYEVDSSKFNRAVRVISGWLGDKEFCSADGYPRALPLLGETGSFSSLVTRYSGDMPYKAMLDELERVGVLERVGQEHVALLRHAYIPSGDDQESFKILGEDTALLVSTIHHNLLSPAEDAWFQRKVSYDNLPASCLPEFKKMVGQHGQHLLEKLNSHLSNHDREKSAPTGNADYHDTRMKAGVGIFYFEEPVLLQADAEDAPGEADNTKKRSTQSASGQKKIQRKTS